MITKLDCSTKAAGTDDAAVTTHLSINWDGMTESDLIALAQQTIVIKLQSAWRRSKDGIPTSADINATDHKVGVRAAKAPVDVVAVAAKMTPEQRAAMIQKLMAMDA